MCFTGPVGQVVRGAAVTRPCLRWQVAMDMDHDGRVTVNEVVAFWLGESARPV